MAGRSFAVYNKSDMAVLLENGEPFADCACDAPVADPDQARRGSVAWGKEHLDCEEDAAG